MESSLNDLYYSIFSLQITSFSIISPIILVFIQLINKEHTYHHTRKLLKNWYIILYFLISSIIVVLSGLGAFVLSIGKFDFFPNHNFNTKLLITNSHFSVAVILLFIIGFIPLILFIIQVIKELDAGFYIKKYLKNVTVRDLELYLYKNYGSPIVTTIYPNPLDKVLKPHRDKKEEKKIKKKYKHQIKKSKKLSKKISKFSEPIFEIPSNIITFNLINYNVNDFNNSLNEYISFYKVFLKKLKKHDLKSNLKRKLTNDYANTLIHLFTNSLSRQFHPFSISIIKSNNTIIDDAYNEKEVSLSDVVFSNFETYVEFLNERNHNEVMELLDIFYNKGVHLLNIENIDEDHTDNMFRNYSRTSERIIYKFDIGRQPIMIGIHNHTIFGEIININHAFFDSYKKQSSKRYPLIILDTNYCIFRAFLKKSALENCSEEYSSFFEEQTYTFFSNPAELCENNLEVKNYKGACLCLMRLCELYELLKEFKKENEIQTQIEYLVILAFKFAAIKHPISVHFMSESPEQYAYGKLSKYKAHITNIDDYVFEYSIKNSIRETESYLFKLSDLFESNFGLNFNWQTKKWNSPNL